MKQFELRQSLIYPALRWHKFFQALRVLEVFFWLASIISLVLLVPGLNILLPRQALALFIIAFIAAIKLRIMHFFFVSDLSQPMPKADLAAALNNNSNLADFLTFEAAWALWQAILRSKKDARGFEPALLLQLLSYRQVALVLARAGISVEDFKATEAGLTATTGLEAAAVVSRAAALAQARQAPKIGVLDLWSGLSELSPLFKQVIFAKDLDKEDIFNITRWIGGLLTEQEAKRRFWQLKNLGAGPGIGKAWAAGWTYHLDRYVVDINKAVAQGKRLPHFIIHRQEMSLLEEALAGSRQANVLLVGEPGVGKETLVYHLAERVRSGQALAALQYRRVLELDIDALLSSPLGLDETTESRFSQILKEAATAGNVILFIDQMQRILSPKLTGGVLDLSLILLPYLEGTELQLIGAIDYRHYHEIIERRGDLKKVFEKIEINPPTKEETILILEDQTAFLEKRYEALITYQVIKAAVNLSDRYIQNVPFPEKALDVLEQALIWLQRQGEGVLRVEHIEKIISQKTEVPVGQVAASEKQKLLNLEAILHQRVIDQEEAIRQVSEAMRRTRAGVAGYNKPIGTFLFLGPTGCGKTETAKALAQAYFGSEKRMVRLDMSEYQQVSDLDKFLGSADGAIEGQLTSRIREDPFGLVLLDEIEKAHPKILNLFLQVLDEGRLTDAQGQTVSFLSMIIIATSNAAAEFIREHILAETTKEVFVIARACPRLDRGSEPPPLLKGGGERRGNLMTEDFQKELIDYLQRQGLFSPEFLNRFDAIVVFKPLSQENLRAVARLMLASLAKRVLAERDIEIIFSDDLINKVAQLGYDPQFGARPMRRVIQDRIESQIAHKILSGQAKRGDKIYLSGQDI